MLVVCKNNKPFEELETTEFRVGQIYRHMPITDNGKTEHLVYGIVMSDKTFKQCFDDYAKVIQDRVKKLVFIKNDKMPTKKEFKEYADVHVYSGRTYEGKPTKNIAVYVGHPKMNCFQIFPIETSKAKAINFAYEVIKELLNGNDSSIDAGRVNWICTGIPISFSFTPRPMILDYEYTNPERYKEKIKSFELDW